MKHSVKLAALSIAFCANVFADPVYLPPASNLTYGASSNNQSIMSSVTNPAAAAAQLGKEDSQYRFGILSSIGGGYEFGNVNDLYNQIDGSKNTITAPMTPADLQAKYIAAGCTASCTPAQSTAFVNDVVATINTSAAVTTLNNTILPALRKDGNATVFFGGHVPLMPFVITKQNWGGSFVLDANASVIANMSFIDDPLLISTAVATTLANNYAAYQSSGSTAAFNNYPAITNDSTLLVKAAVVAELGLGYSRQLMKKETGDLAAGARLKYYQVKLARDAQKLTNSTGAQNTFKATQTYSSSSGVGVDLGTLWTARRYRVGAWVNNINGPSFKYNSIDTTVLAYAGTNVPNQLSADQDYKMKPQVEMEGAFYSESQNWVLNVALDANAVPDPVGRDFQWATLSAAYATDSWWIPGIRLGYRSNLAGSKLSYATAGLTMFKAFSLDVAYGMDSIKDNQGNSIPRSAMLNLGMQMTF